VVWSSLGTVSPDWDWRQFDIPLVGDAVIRVTQTYDEPSIGRLINKLIFGEVYVDLGRRTLFTAYRKSDARIYTVAIPKAIADRGFGVRYLEVKHNAYGVINPDSWSVTLEAWQDTDPAGNVALIADGGTYGSL
jgi:hypothetical protein